MFTRRLGKPGLLVALLAVSITLATGCGKETVPSTPPLVVSTNPASGATGVLINQVVSATFSEPMNPASITGSTFTLTAAGGVTVAGTVAYTATGSVATFTPNAALAFNTVYTATITTGVANTLGIESANNLAWSFTTAAQPTVISTVPTNGAPGVPINQVLSATFSKAMNPATITNATFTLAGPGGTAVTGVVTYTATGSIATFTPSVPLAYGTIYTATITTGATDTNGYPLATNFPWTFTTATRPTVIATIPGDGATGVPVNQVLSATFSKVLNCATLTPASFLVSGPGGTAVGGTVTCTGAVATFTPTVLLLTNTLYTATLTTVITDSTGDPLASNHPWTFRTVPAATAPTVISTTPAKGATAVPINQAITATFSEAMNPATINATTFTVKTAGGVAVIGVVTYTAAGSVATFTPATSLAVNTVYSATITTGAMDLAGNALASNYVWTFTTAAAPDTTRPTVISTVPANLAPGVPLNQVVSATFSEAMNAATINSATFTLAGPGATAVAGQVAYASVGNTATFTPTANLVANTLYTATITTGVTDLAGNALAVNHVWTFTTGAALDTVPPQIVSTIPASAAINVPLNQVVSATFSEAMNPLTITTATFTLTGPGATSVAGTVSYDPINFIASFTPTAPLTASSIYTATVTTGATDLAGNPLGTGGAPNPWSFTTGTVLVVSPINLGSAALFGGFGGSAGMTNQGTATVINGNIGTTGVSTIITGFHDNTPGCVYTETPLNMGLVNGTIDTAPPPPTVACPNEGTAVTAAAAAQAAADALTAYNELVALPGGLDVSTCPGCGGGLAGELGNRTLAPGVYKSAPGSYSISQGDLVLDAQGDPNAFWAFQMATTLTVGTPTAHRSVLLVNGAQAKNVYWQVGTAATINGILGGGTMTGTIISQAGISVSTAGVAAVTTVNGRLLVLTGPVTMVNTVVNTPAP
ncbi:MAG TPA: Ig-like domain-containing protein [Acidobacteriaceae bacterium]|nr:Ig-like domain-containing protein [Acidobacteriaceae bacterium]